MQTINILLRRDLNPQERPASSKIEVVPDKVFVYRDEEIKWYFHSTDHHTYSDAAIAFEDRDPTAMFFDGGKAHVGKASLANGHGEVTGMTPKPTYQVQGKDVPRLGVDVLKYRVQFTDTSSDPVRTVELDPEIIRCWP